MYSRDKNLCISVFHIVLIYFPIPFCEAMSLLEFFIGPSLGKSLVKSKNLEIVPAVSKTSFFFLNFINVTPRKISCIKKIIIIMHFSREQPKCIFVD